MPSTSSPLKRPNFPHRFFRAGAGAGKTTTLVNEVIRLASDFQTQEGRLPRVVVTTFTRKATQELKERLLEEGIKSGSESLLRFVTSPSYLMITTIHGILAQFLTQMSGSLGLDAEFRVVDELKVSRRWKSSLRRLLIENSEMAELLERYSFVQLSNFARAYVLRAVTHHMPEPLTEDKIWESVQSSIQKFEHEIGRCLEELKPESLSAKWSELIERLRHLNESAKRMNVSTASPKEWRETREAWIDLAGDISLPRGKAAKEASEFACDSVRAIKEELKSFAELEFSPESWKRMTEDARLLDRVGNQLASAWKQEKLESGELSIEDLEVLSLCLLKEFPVTGQQFSEHWDYWFVDEFQDTSPSQVTLLRHLMGDAGQFVVGDPQQSIYFFRGARSEVFFQKEKEFQDRGIRTEYLKTNRRSHPSLLFFFNDLFRSVSSQHFQDMEPNPKIEIPSKPHHVARIFLLEKREHELEAIVWQVRKWAAQGVAYKDIAILTRTHKDLEEVAARLNHENFPTQVMASGGFYDRQEILDALTLLRFLVNPKDDVNLLCLIRSPWVHVSDPVITSNLDARSPHTVWDQLCQGEEHDSIKILKNYLFRAQTEGVSGVFQEALEELGFFSFCHAHDVTGLREANLWKLLLKLKEEEHRAGFSFIEFISRTAAGLEDGLEHNDGDAVSAFEPNRVVLMTVHASKGLGIPYVIVPFIQKDLRASRRETFLYDELENRWLTASLSPDGSGWMYPPPMRQVVERIQNLEREEHLRLLYVALTRARSEVMLSASDKKGKNSWLNAIKMDLDEGLHESDHYAYEVHAVVPESEAVAEKAYSPIRVVPLRPLWKQNLSTPVRVNVTSLVQNSAAASTAKNFTHLQVRIEAIRRGVRIHKILELIAKRKEIALGPLGLRKGDPHFDVFERSIQFLVKQTKLPYVELIQAGHAEWSFAFLEGGLEVRGQIDLWGVVNGEVWIVDYKTGSSKFLEKAFIQMKIYASALRAAGVEGKMRAAAVFPLEEKIEIRDL